MRSASFVLLFATFLVALAPAAHAQSAPQFVRDYVYGPGGRLAVTIEPDTYAPDQPTGLTAVQDPDACTQVDLSWDAATDIGSGVWGYYVYRNGSFRGSTTSTSYNDTGINPGSTYSYQVKTKDNAGNYSSLAYVNIKTSLCQGQKPIKHIATHYILGQFPHILFIPLPDLAPDPVERILRRIRLEPLHPGILAGAAEGGER